MKQSLFQRVYRFLLGHPIARWIVILGSLVYLLSPIDISPDVIPIVGWVDDGILAALLATGITEMVLERRRALQAKKTAALLDNGTTSLPESAVDNTPDLPSV